MDEYKDSIRVTVADIESLQRQAELFVWGRAVEEYFRANGFKECSFRTDHIKVTVTVNPQ